MGEILKNYCWIRAWNARCWHDMCMVPSIDMYMKAFTVDWQQAIKPLLRKYKNRQHPLEGKNAYQYLVMVVLSARSSDKLINSLAPALFHAYPTLRSLSKATPEALYPYISKVINFRHKAIWLTDIAAQLKKGSAIPLDMDKLVELPGIGRKSANVILRETGAKPAGIMVDLHTLRVAPRLGITNEKDGPKMEQRLMELFPLKQWDIGMALSFHGREICRPKPQCGICLMRKVCAYYKSVYTKL